MVRRMPYRPFEAVLTTASLASDQAVLGPASNADQYIDDADVMFPVAHQGSEQAAECQATDQ